MRLVTRYQCLVCKRLHRTTEEAEECERSHGIDNVKVGEEYARVHHGWWDNGRCSQCGTPADRSVYGDDFYIDTEEIDYCPTCGARMDLGLNGKVVKK